MQSKLTRKQQRVLEYLQHEINTALQKFADNSGSVVVIPANMQGFDMILDTKGMSKE